MRALVIALCLAAPASWADAPVVIGTAARAGQGQGGDRLRIGASLYGLVPTGHGWLVGGSLDGDGEAFSAGPSCGRGATGLQPSLGVTCIDAGASAHVLLAHQWSRVRIAAGPGLGWMTTTAGLRDRLDERWRLSALARLSYRVFLGAGRVGSWYMGVGIEERFVVGIGARAAATLSFEGSAP